VAGDSPPDEGTLEPSDGPERDGVGPLSLKPVPFRDSHGGPRGFEYRHGRLHRDLVPSRELESILQPLLGAEQAAH
jgi:hypothetical protein